jgi:outer membrane protein assembly factor BamA
VRLGLATICVLAAARVASAGVIQEIRVEENAKTTPETVALIAKVAIGDEWLPEMAQEIRDRLVTSGLFKDVEVYWDPVPGGVRVHMLVQDKHSWVVAPAFYNQPTNTGGGLGFGENNLFGLNQKLLLYGQIATGSSFFLGVWVIPSLGGSHFYAQLDTYLKDERNIEYASPKGYRDNPRPLRESRLSYLNAGFKLGYEFFRGGKLDVRLRAAPVHYARTHLAEGATIEDVTGNPADTAVPNPGAEGWDVSNEWTLTIDRKANWYGLASGYRYTLAYERGMQSLGSDFHYWQLGATAYDARRLFGSHNLVLRGALDVGHHMPFQHEFVTGGTTMRGWANSQFRGDLRLGGNAEYSVPVFEIDGFAVRGLAFWDTAYTTFQTIDNPERNYLPGAAVRGLSGFKNSVGVGTRLFLRQVVIPLLGVDFGYGLESGDFKVYLAIGLTD